MFDGILLINKDQGWTSHDVVAKVRGILTREKRESHEGRGFCTEMQRKKVASSTEKRTDAYVERATQQTAAAMRSKDGTAASLAGSQAVRCKCRVKVGHTGTLDPLATGLMIVVTGSYCKRAQEFSKLDKVYEVEMTLGSTSDTGDAEGQLTKKSDQKPTEQQLQAAVEQFVGEIEQTPPAYSAVKVGGKRAYQLAREGKEVKLEPRTVSIYSITDIAYRYPVIRFTAHVSSGTYIRSLVEDIGAELGTGAYMSALKRTKVGVFDIKDAITVTEFTSRDILTKRL